VWRALSDFAPARVRLSGLLENTARGGDRA
jgi:hypothetical protein